MESIIFCAVELMLPVLVIFHVLCKNLHFSYTCYVSDTYLNVSYTLNVQSVYFKSVFMRSWSLIIFIK